MVTLDGLTKRGSEAFYWIAILIVRAAATNIADFSIDKQHLGYVPVGIVLALILAGLIVFYYRSGRRRVTGDLPPTNGLYWVTMLTAGSLGTIIGDGVGHAFHSVQVGVPISAGLSTIALALILSSRMRMSWRTALTYWVAVVVVRWWGTNVGDIVAFTAGLLVSLAITGTAMALILFVWREPATEHDIFARPEFNA
ncbi:hypothetical protein [Lichenicoccus sp.]|uniref:hypothetical protein n=1 Tax=Lichenicoccus sp. TaxID=2781899 RepID=UPI003D0DDE27